MEQYLIPANSKKSQLIFNTFRPIDLAILVIGFCTSVILLLLDDNMAVKAMFLKLAPVLVCGFLVVPIPFYHNVLTFLIEMYRYFTRPTRYLWRGWCVRYVTDDESKK